MVNKAELLPDEWTLTINSKHKSERIKQIEEWFKKGLIKIPDVSHFIIKGTQWTPPPSWYLTAVAYRKKYNGE